MRSTSKKGKDKGGFRGRLHSGCSLEYRFPTKHFSFSYGFQLETNPNPIAPCSTSARWPIPEIAILQASRSRFVRSLAGHKKGGGWANFFVYPPAGGCHGKILFAAHLDTTFRNVTPFHGVKAASGEAKKPASLLHKSGSPRQTVPWLPVPRASPAGRT